MRRIAAIVAGATLVSLLDGCSSLLAPKAPDSMPAHTRAVYDEIKNAGKQRSKSYTTGVEVATENERFSFEISITKKGNWEAYVRVPGNGKCTTVFQSDAELRGWTSRNSSEREPLEDQAARSFYDAHVEKAKEAVEKGTVTFPHEDPIINGQFLGYNFKLP